MHPTETSSLVPADLARLRTALATGDIDDLQHLFDETGFGLIDVRPEGVLRLLESTPPALLARRPRLLLMALQAHQVARASSADAELLPLLENVQALGAQLAGRLSEFTDPRDFVAAGTLAMIGARLGGDVDRARRIGEVVHRTLLRSFDATAWRRDRDSFPGILEMQRGLTETVAGSFSAAMPFYRTAASRAGEPPAGHLQGINAAANAALLSAVDGHHELAQSWLERFDRFEPAPAWLSYLLGVGASIARAWLATDALDEQGARAALLRAGDADTSIELWPFLAAAHVRADVAFGAPARGLERLRAVGFAHDVDTGTWLGADRVLLRAHLDVLEALGDSNVVLRLAENAGHHPRTAVPVARVYLHTGHPDRAARLAHRVVRGGRASAGDDAELIMILATCARMRGDDAAASRLFDRVLAVAGPYAAAAMRRVGVQSPAPDGSLPPSRQRRDHETLPVVDLTPREAEVLALLRTDDSMPQIAVTLGITSNTARTHLKNVYRKLGVSSRAAAVERTAALGLLL